MGGGEFGMGPIPERLVLHGAAHGRERCAHATTDNVHYYDYCDYYDYYRSNDHDDHRSDDDYDALDHNHNHNLPSHHDDEEHLAGSERGERFASAGFCVQRGVGERCGWCICISGVNRLGRRQRDGDGSGDGYSDGDGYSERDCDQPGERREPARRNHHDEPGRPRERCEFDKPPSRHRRAGDSCFAQDAAHQATPKPYESGDQGRVRETGEEIRNFGVREPEDRACDGRDNGQSGCGQNNCG